jgi:hypothetical protein
MIKFEKTAEEICFKKFEPDSKIGIIASVSPEGYPHMALISSIMLRDKASIMWGQFSQGLSKKYLKDNPKTGFAVVSVDQFFWTGKALHTGEAIKGEDFERFNNKPMFRYNSYFGIGVVHYEDLIDISVGEKLPIAKILYGNILSNYAKLFAGKSDEKQLIPKFGVKLAKNLMTLKFISYVDKDGYPRIIPALQGVPAAGNRLIFSLAAYPELLNEIQVGAKAAVFLGSLDLTSILLQGTFEGIKSFGGAKCAVFKTEKVYNSMVPVGGYIES